MGGRIRNPAFLVGMTLLVGCAATQCVPTADAIAHHIARAMHLLDDCAAHCEPTTHFGALYRIQNSLSTLMSNLQSHAPCERAASAAIGPAR